ncbi:MAG TPA: Os1348 family NHLP clan protein [Chloroflexota bacterium]|nr:Os1348 family NHLP clan protein [Chloroflexota bacterium]
MSETLRQVIERASTDAAFRARLQSDPASALAGYDLTPEETAALLSRDAADVPSLGVDARATKQYARPPLDNPAGPGEVFSQGPFGF